MSLLEAIILGAIQGATEFLPVSSSGHLVFFQQFFSVNAPAVLFDVTLHAGTLAAVLIFFRKDITEIIKALFAFPRDLSRSHDHDLISCFFSDKNRALAAMIIAGSVPTAVIGLFLKRYEDLLFSSLGLVGFAWISTGILLWFTKNLPSSKQPGDINFFRALMVGIAQGAAVVPGISRSGTTIACALFLGAGRDAAARFSFLLSIPAVFGALILELAGHARQTVFPASLLVAGTISAFVVGYIALKILVWMVNKGRLQLFSPYCLFMGGLTLFLALA